MRDALDGFEAIGRLSAGASGSLKQKVNYRLNTDCKSVLLATRYSLLATQIADREAEEAAARIGAEGVGGAVG